MKPLRIQIVVFLIAGHFALTGCQSCHNSQIPQASAMDFQAIEDLLRGLREMGAAYYAALDSGTERNDDEISSRFWSEPIKALHPIRVYKDQGNIVIVQVVTNGFECGKYVAQGTSSHVAGREYHFTCKNGPVSHYRKRIMPDVFWERNEHYFKPKLR